MSEQNPPGTPAEGPDPFAELLKGLVEEPTAEQSVPPAQPVPAQPATGSVDVPTVAFTPVEEPAVVRPAVEQSPVTSPPLQEPTAAFSPEATAALPEPIAASGTPSAGLPPTVVLPGTLDPTAATTVLAGGAGGGLPPSEPPRGGGFRDWDPRRKALFITLVSVAGVLLIALVVLLVVLLSGRGDEPTPTPTRTGTSAPTPTPTRTGTPTPTPTPTPTVKPAIQSFAASAPQVTCTDQTSNVPVKLGWTVVGNPTQIAIASGPQIVDAIANPFQNGLPSTATDFQMQFSCANTQWAYTLTIQAPDGNKYSQVITITRNYTPPAPTNPTIVTFTVEQLDSNVCDPDEIAVLPVPRIKVVWETKDATAVDIPQLPGAEQPNGSYELDYDCSVPSMEFDITATGASGTTPATGATSIVRPEA